MDKQYQMPIQSDIPPFRMIGGLYFVGSRAVSVHLIDTGEGLVMIDTGYPNMCAQIQDSIRALGFNIEDIRIILHSHGHYDHIGNTQFIKRLSNAKTYISRIDNDIVNGKLDLSWASELGYERLPKFDCDVLLEDGDVIELGKLRIHCVLTPGHTAGVMSFFFDIEDNGQVYRAAMHGGVGTNSMEKSFLTRYNLSLDCRDVFRQKLHELKELKVDVVLGNHPDQNDTEGKRERLLHGDALACVDAGEWTRFLTHCEHRLDQMLYEEERSQA